MRITLRLRHELAFDSRSCTEYEYFILIRGHYLQLLQQLLSFVDMPSRAVASAGIPPGATGGGERSIREKFTIYHGELLECASRKLD